MGESGMSALVRDVYDDRVRVVREWLDAASEEYCAQLEIRIPGGAVRRAARGNPESMVSAFARPVSQQIEALERNRAYDDRPRLTLGKRRGKQ